LTNKQVGMSSIKATGKRVCCILGGTSGIGKAVADAFAKNGDTVIVSSRDRRKVKKAYDSLLSMGNDAKVLLACDVTKKSSLEILCKKILSAHGRIDVLVVAAGMHRKIKALDMKEQDWAEVIRTNLTGTFLADQVFGKEMVRAKKGCIINIGSLGSFVALTDTAAYCASKGGVVMLTKCLAVEWAKSGVRVNALIPGVIRTPLNEKALSDKKRLSCIISKTPMERLGKAEEIINAVMYLASPSSTFVTGSCVAVDGGFLAWSGF
jgi:2-dehydro-3-deoxy-D-gluconate 5-dehydrogenase